MTANGHAGELLSLSQNVLQKLSKPKPAGGGQVSLPDARNHSKKKVLT